MKKSKILGLSLGTVALTTVAVATPVILTSCGDSETVITDVLVKEDALALTQAASTYKLDRAEGTNDFTVTTPEATWTMDDIFGNSNGKKSIFANEAGMFVSTTYLTPDQLKKWFDPKAVDGAQDTTKMIVALPGIVDKNGNVKYPSWDELIETDFDFSGQQNSSKVVYKNIKFVQIDQSKSSGTEGEPLTTYKKLAEKSVTISFSLTIKPKTK